MLIAMFIIGVLWVILGFMVSAHGAVNRLVLKAFPFISGMFVAVYAASQLGWVTVGV